MKRLLLIVSCLLLPVSVQAEVDCQAPQNTVEINECAMDKLKQATQELDKYFAASLEQHAEDKELVKAIEVAQNHWQQYMQAHCSSVYTQWRDGTIRGVMAASCKTQLTKQRTHEIWETFLTYMDSTPPVLVEPILN
ncbi:lysozyme inhibitor LprI family protein [Vibrio aphrogenes]|uniref:lysozyme inhibitor LprI family protein n=1 Tax=Vibrio aphrogenes TaxID=1891186 RepID=UPI000B355250|nr:lysozyme inhibitor LprI family protein [Vibrio aphrogenes]